MDNILNYLKIGFAAIGGVLGWLFGGFDALIYALIAFVVIDYITGVLVAICKKNVSSEIGFKGISKKIMIFLLVALGNIIDQYVLTSGSALRTMIIMFYLTNEGISIIENAEKMGMPVPAKLKNTLKQFGGSINSDNNSKDQ